MRLETQNLISTYSLMALRRLNYLYVSRLAGKSQKFTHLGSQCVDSSHIFCFVVVEIRCSNGRVVFRTSDTYRHFHGAWRLVLELRVLSSARQPTSARIRSSSILRSIHPKRPYSTGTNGHILESEAHSRSQTVVCEANLLNPL